MQQNKSKFIAIGAVAILILGGYLGWQWFGASSGVGSVLTSTSENDASSAQVQELINFITELKTIRIETALFSDPVFLSLADYSVQIALQPVGRRNPFEPLSGIPAAR